MNEIAKQDNNKSDQGLTPLTYQARSDLVTQVYTETVAVDLKQARHRLARYRSIAAVASTIIVAIPVVVLAVKALVFQAVVVGVVGVLIVAIVVFSVRQVKQCAPQTIEVGHKSVTITCGDDRRQFSLSGAIGYHLFVGIPSMEWGSIVALRSYKPGRHISYRYPPPTDTIYHGVAFPYPPGSLGIELAPDPNGDANILVLHTANSSRLRQKIAEAGGPAADVVITGEKGVKVR